ncbi:MAG: tail fiber domain-containing protein [Chitinophagaceae bacterium]|nr:tail fiber domain-containing protein [Chitinophagaceae bacterium]
MKKTVLVITLLICYAKHTVSQSIGIGTTTPDSSAILHVQSTTKGMLLPRMTTVQRNAIAHPATGLMIYNTDDQCTDVFNGTGWLKNCGLLQGDSVAVSAEIWILKTNVGQPARAGAVGFSIGTKGYVLTGANNGVFMNDLWEYNSLNNTWTQKASFPGAARYAATGFSIGGKGYIGLGYDGLSFKKDFWEYDPVNNSWVQKTSFPGNQRYLAVGFSINGKGYIGTGADSNSVKNDFWEYDPTTNSWTQKANFAGTARYAATGFSIGGKGYIGTGFDTTGHRNDFWEYDPASDSWTQKANLTGAPRAVAFGFSVGGKGYIGSGSSALTLYNDFWEYNPASNLWSQKTDFAGSGRTLTATFSIGNKGYVATGADNYYPKNDLWEYNQQGYSVASFTNNTSQNNFSDGIWTKTVMNEISSNGDAVFIKSNGNVGIGTALPDAKLTVAGNTSLMGNVGIGTTPGFPLTFGSTTGDKISLYGESGSHYGIGVQSGLLQIHSNLSADDIGFGYGSSSSFTERMRIKGNGDVGIGTVFPQAYGHGGTNKIIELNNPASGGTIQSHLILSSAGTSGSLGGITWAGTNLTGERRTAFIGNMYETSNAARLTFYTRNNSASFGERMTITGNGNVGIGTSTPGFPLNFASTLGDKISLWGESGNHYGIGVQSGLLQIHSNQPTDDIAFGYGSSGSFVERVRIKGNGYLGIGTNPTTKLDIAGINNWDLTNSEGDFRIGNSSYRIKMGVALDGGGAGAGRIRAAGGINVLYLGAGTSDVLTLFSNGNATLAGTLTENSDERMKTDIQPLRPPLKNLIKITGYTYRWIDESKDHDLQTGVLAQEIQKVYPHLVKENRDGELSVNYSGLTPILLEGIKEQQFQIEKLKKEVSELKQLVQQLVKAK